MFLQRPERDYEELHSVRTMTSSNLILTCIGVQYTPIEADHIPVSLHCHLPVLNTKTYIHMSSFKLNHDIKHHGEFPRTNMKMYLPIYK